MRPRIVDIQVLSWLMREPAMRPSPFWPVKTKSASAPIRKFGWTWKL